MCNRKLACNLLALTIFAVAAPLALGGPQYGGGGYKYGQQHSGGSGQFVVVQDPVEISNPAAGIGFKRRARAVLVSSGRGGDISGTLTFAENDEGVLIKGEITGLQPGNHGFHIHMDGNLGDGCNAAGSHFNPTNQQHGSIQSNTRHVGDLGNISTPNRGTTTPIVFDRQITLDPSSVNSIIGRAIVIHERMDDLGQGGDEESLKTGNAGPRLACGIIVAV